MGKDAAGDLDSSRGDAPLQHAAAAQQQQQQHNIQHPNAQQLNLNLHNLNQLNNAAAVLVGLGGGASSSNNPPAGSGRQLMVRLIQPHG